MAPTDALILDNFFPTVADVRLRKGHTTHATGLGANVESLLPWRGPASEKLFGAAGANIYEVTSAGAVGSAVVSSLTNARFQHCNVTNAGGSYLWICNGADAPRHYDGATWSTPTLTGVTGSNIINVEVFKERLFFAPKDQLAFWYLPVNAIAGAVSSFDLGQVCALGGYLLAIGTWTRDAGNGPDDYIAFVTSEGEIAVYQGTDPSSASAWSIVGLYRIGRPIGRRCCCKLGSDLIVLTEDGVVSMGEVVSVGVAARGLTDKIRGLISAETANKLSNYGWELCHHARGSMLLVNVPAASSMSDQYVMNTQTGAWCRFRSQNGFCFATLDGDLYLGGVSVVYQADNGTTDDGAAIEGTLQQAYNAFGSPAQSKQFKLIRPYLLANDEIEAGIGLYFDFEPPKTLPTGTVASLAQAVWDVAAWDEAEWGDSLRRANRARGAPGVGRVASLYMNVSASNADIQLKSTDYLFEVGGAL